MVETETSSQTSARLAGLGPALRAHAHLAAALLLLALAIVFIGSALAPAGGEILGGYDMRGYYYPYYDQVRAAVRAGRLPFWEPSLFGGFPFLAQPQQNVFYPLLWPAFLLPLNAGISLYMLLHIWVAGLGMYLLVRFWGGRWLPAMLAAIAFAFSGLLAGRLWAGHSTVYALDAWTPWVVLALSWSVQRRSVWPAVVAGVPMALALLAGHIPSFMYVGIIWGLFVLYLVISEKGHRVLVLRQATIMVAVALTLAAVQLLPFLQYSLASERLAEADYEFATDYSFPPAHLITLVVPEYFGEPIRTGYWSVPTFEELTYYAGLLALLGIVLALRRPTALVWFLLAMMVVGMALALGRYGVLYPLVYQALPPFRIVRAPGRAAFLFLFAATALLGHALSNWLDLLLPERLVRLGATWRWALAVAAVLGVAALAATGAVFMAVHPTETSGRLWHQVGGLALALVILLLGGGLIWAHLATPPGQGRRQTAIGIALVLLTVTDMWLFAYKFVRLEPPSPDPMWLDARAVIGETESRVLPWGVSIFEQNGAMQVGLNSVFGYESLEPANHIALAASVPDPRSSAYDVLGARYVVAPTELQQYEEGQRPLVLVEQRGAAWVYERARPLAVARLVYEVEVVADNAAAIARIHQPDFDPARTAIVATDPACALGPTPEENGTAEIVSHAPTSWRIRTASAAPALLLLAETAYPGWQATIDGQPAESLLAYTTIRALCVPAGEHEVVWRYVPLVYWAGGLVSLFALGILGIALIRLGQQRRTHAQS